MKKLNKKDLELTFIRQPGKTKTGRPKFKFVPKYIKDNATLFGVFDSFSDYVDSTGLTLYFWQAVDKNFTKEDLKQLDLEALATDFCTQVNRHAFTTIDKHLMGSVMPKYYADVCVVANIYENLYMEEYQTNHLVFSKDEDGDDYVKDEDFEKYANQSREEYENLLITLDTAVSPILAWGEKKGIIDENFALHIDEDIENLRDAQDPDFEEEDFEYDSDNMDRQDPRDLTDEEYNIGSYAVSRVENGQRTLRLDAEKYCRALLYKMKNPHDDEFELISTDIHDDEEQEMLMQYTFLDWLQKSGRVSNDLLDKKFKFMELLNYIVSQSEATSYTVQLLAQTKEQEDDDFIEEDDFIRFFIEINSMTKNPQSLRDYELGANALEAILFMGFCAYAELNPKSDGVIVIRSYNEKKMLRAPKSHPNSAVPEQEVYNFFLHEGEIVGLPLERVKEMNSYDPDTGRAEELEFGLIYKDTEELLAQKTTHELMKSLMTKPVALLPKQKM